MFDLHSLATSVGINETEPVFYSVKKFNAFTKLLEVASPQFDSGFPGFIKHQFHIGEDVAGILPYCNLIAFLPEFPRLFPDGLDEPEFLHVSRRKRAVEIIYKRYNWYVPHNLSILPLAISHKLSQNHWKYEG